MEVLRFYLLKQNFYLSLSAFLDAGQVVTPVSFEVNFTAMAIRVRILQRTDESLHTAWAEDFGGMNQNFVGG